MNSPAANTMNINSSMSFQNDVTTLESTMPTKTDEPTIDVTTYSGTIDTTLVVDNTTFPVSDWVDTRSRLGVLPPLICLIIFTCGANIIVMICTRVEQRLRKPTNMYVFSLAVVDCIVGLFVMSSMAVYTLHGYWPLGQTMCSVWVVIDFTCCTISMFHLCLIAHDRYMALTKPLKYKHPRRARYIGILIFLAWFVGILVWVPAIIAFRTVDEQAELDCYYFPNKYYILIQSTLVYFLPIIILVYFYIRCLVGLHNQYAKVNSMNRDRSTENGVQVEGDIGSTVFHTEATKDVNTSDIGSISGQDGTSRQVFEGHNSLPLPGQSNKAKVAAHNQSKAEKRRQAHIRNIRTLGIIIVAFLFCWLPFCVFWPVSAFCETCIPAVAYEYSYWSAYINSTVNPLLYFMCNKDFRVAFKTICRKIKLIK